MESKKEESQARPAEDETTRVSASKAEAQEEAADGLITKPQPTPTVKQLLQNLVAAVEELRPKPPRPKPLQEVADQFNALLTITIKTIGFLIIVLIILLVVVPVLRKKLDAYWTGRETLSLETFVVAPDLEKSGLSSEVIASKLADQINYVQRRAQGGSRMVSGQPMVTPNVGTPENTAPDVELPGTKISLNSLVQYIASLFGRQPTQVKGELTRVGDNLRLTVRLLRDTDEPEKELKKSFDGKDIDALLLEAAQYVLRYIAPYALASYKYSLEERDAAFEFANYALYHAPDADDCYAQALLGAILTDEGRSSREPKKYEEAEKHYEAALKSCSGSAPLYISWGYTLEQKGDYQKTNGNDKKAKKDSEGAKKDYEAAKKDYEGAVAKYKQATEIDPKSAVAFVRWGQIYLYQLNNPNEARAKFQQAIEADSRYAWSYISLGIMEQMNGNQKLSEDKKEEAARFYDAAISNYQKAIANDPESYMAYFYWANTLYAQRKWDAAMVPIRKATELNPRSSDSYEYWAAFLEHKGDTKGAIEKARKVIELAPQAVSSYLYLHKLLFLSRDYGAAAENLEQAVLSANQKDDNYYRLYSSWGDVLFEMGQDDEARKKYEEANKLEPDNPYADYGLGNILYRDKNYQGAIDKYDKAIQLEDQQEDLAAKAYTKWGDALREMRRMDDALAKYSKAIEEYRKVVTFDPDSIVGRDAQNSIARLEEVKKQMGLPR